MNIVPIPTTVDDLRTQWTTLHDLDKAESVKRIRKLGKSLRSLAKDLCCSESSLRYLLKAAEAPLPDRIDARKGKISTRELVHRSKQAAKAKVAKIKATEHERREKQAEEWSIRICSWLQEQGLAWAHQENILEETRRELFLADVRKTLPKIDVPKNTSLKSIIDHLRPDDSCWEQSLQLYFYISWLAHWSVAAISDQTVRDAAIALALTKTQKLETVRPRRKRPVTSIRSL